MKVKEAIKFLDDMVDKFKCISSLNYKHINNKKNEIVELLEQGKKYKVMVWKINNEILSDEYDPIYIGDDPNKESLHNRIKNIIHEED